MVKKMIINFICFLKGKNFNSQKCISERGDWDYNDVRGINKNKLED